MDVGDKNTPNISISSVIWYLEKLLVYSLYSQFCKVLQEYMIFYQFTSTADVSPVPTLEASVKTRTMYNIHGYSGWGHEMEKFSALLAICADNSPVTGEFPSQRPVMRSFDVFCDLRLNKRLSKQLWGWWFETPSRLFWRPLNAE